MSEEQIILVDSYNQPLGTALKLASHHANTPLHRAFSCFLFKGDGQFLLTQRALSKLVFPGIWTNGCCGHPAPGESNEEAVRRRVRQELGITPENLTLVLPDFRYQAEMNGIMENEICPVFVALALQPPCPDPTEVEHVQWIPWSSFIERVQRQPETLSPWSVLETRQLLQTPAFDDWWRANISASS